MIKLSIGLLAAWSVLSLYTWQNLTASNDLHMLNVLGGLDTGTCHFYFDKPTKKQQQTFPLRFQKEREQAGWADILPFFSFTAILCVFQ
jgi:hypothetical protein